MLAWCLAGWTDSQPFLVYNRSVRLTLLSSRGNQHGMRDRQCSKGCARPLEWLLKTLELESFNKPYEYYSMAYHEHLTYWPSLVAKCQN